MVLTLMVNGARGYPDREVAYLDGAGAITAVVSLEPSPRISPRDSSGMDREGSHVPVFFLFRYCQLVTVKFDRSLQFARGTRNHSEYELLTDEIARRLHTLPSTRGRGLVYK